ncbi:hypothetical protein LCGC14_1029740 [marine sediment metagenome]|uniref:HNH nuclease domain-containing protein n=1 Tax=marine sediment metagenome TaxID=412755 RepID=A0A0F9NGR7_9ZZZZ
MAFNIDEISRLLAKCHRRCCICHRFCGVKMETDHIEQIAEGGTDDIDNAISVCFECHAEIHSYNNKHPRGRKFRPKELAQHKKQWLEICQKRPEIFISAGWESDVGPLQALIDELEFNYGVAGLKTPNEIACLFQNKQFFRAIGSGSMSMLVEDLKDVIYDAYMTINSCNELISTANNYPLAKEYNVAVTKVQNKLKGADQKIKKALDMLNKFLIND